MSNKSNLGLRSYPDLMQEFHKYISKIGENFLLEVSPFLSSLPKESVSEGVEEVIERLDGTRASMTFEEVIATDTLSFDVFYEGRFDELLSSIYQVSHEMAGTTVRRMLDSIFETASERGNVRNTANLSVETICEFLENTELTFAENGEMDQKFVIPPHVEEKFGQIMSDPQVQSIIDRKRREYFAKKDS